jgi:methylmalonyl-CoA/ethylmalonyl-CoA epimerase
MSGSTATPFGLSRIGQIAVPVTDIDRAIAFYRDVLGMRFLFQAPPGLGCRSRDRPAGLLVSLLAAVQ